MLRLPTVKLEAGDSIPCESSNMATTGCLQRGLYRVQDFTVLLQCFRHGVGSKIGYVLSVSVILHLIKKCTQVNVRSCGAIS